MEKETDVKWFRNGKFIKSYLRSNNFKLVLLGAISLLVLGIIFLCIKFSDIGAGFVLFFIMLSVSVVVVGYANNIQRFIISLPLLIGSIILMGIFFLKPYAYKTDLSLTVPVLIIIGFFPVIYIKIIKEVKGNISLPKIHSLKELINTCFKSKGFSLLMVLLSWLLFFVVVFHKWVIKYTEGEMNGIFVLFAYLIIFTICLLTLSMGMFLATRKVKKTVLSVLSFMVMAVISMPIFVIVMFVLLDISEYFIAIFPS